MNEIKVLILAIAITEITAIIGFGIYLGSELYDFIKSIVLGGSK